jgi:hypothetical protein
VILQIPKNLDLSMSNNRKQFVGPSTSKNEKNIGRPPLKMRSIFQTVRFLSDYPPRAVAIFSFKNLFKTLEAKCQKSYSICVRDPCAATIHIKKKKIVSSVFPFKSFATRVAFSLLQYSPAGPGGGEGE